MKRNDEAFAKVVAALAKGEVVMAFIPFETFPPESMKRDPPKDRGQEDKPRSD